MEPKMRFQAQEGSRIQNSLVLAQIQEMMFW